MNQGVLIIFLGKEGMMRDKSSNYLGLILGIRNWGKY